MITEKTQIQSVLDTNSGIDIGYLHSSKRVATGEAVERAGSILKWYEVYPPELSVPGEIRQLALDFLKLAPIEDLGLGFSLLHRCGQDFYFLIVCTWRNSNEIWETVFYKDGDTMSGFAPFPRDGAHKPAFCVWELVPVWHEQQAWVRFLTSSRDETAAQLWLADQIAGDA